MPSPYKVLTLLSRGDLAGFHKLLTSQPPKTVDQLWSWLKAKGYKISRNAVYGYAAASGIWSMRIRPGGGVGAMPEVRRGLRRDLTRLDDAWLRIVAAVAAAIAGNGTAKRRTAR